MERVLAILLAGGAGERLYPLTKNNAKPAVPFGGAYRIIDVTLSNCINSKVRRIFILTQYKALELNRHIREGWRILSPELGEFIELVPPMKRMREDWYLGTADAVYQNTASIVSEGREFTLILSGDHIYKMNYADMLDWHLSRHADVTIATIQAPHEQASRFGVAAISKDSQVIGFQEKPSPEDAVRSSFNPSMVSVSMGVYLFNTSLLLQSLLEDAEDPGSSHDFGKDILPNLLAKARVIAYDFRDLNDKTVSYWRDVGTLDAYYEANMDLVAVTPEFNLYDRGWPIRTLQLQYPPAKFVFAQEGRRMGIALDSIVSAGCIVSGGRVFRSVLSPGVRVNSYCEVENSILLHNVEIGRHSRVRNAIIDAGVKVPEGSLIGYERDRDIASGYSITEAGVVVVPSEQGAYGTITI
jgi:glucose-1-phosphate adenylyltransferase